MAPSLKEAVDATVLALDELCAAADAAPGSLRPRMRSTLDAQARSLRVLQDECRAGTPTRRAWSLGQAALPVLGSLVNAAAKPAVGVSPAVIDDCRCRLDDLSRSLLAHAEGRTPLA